MGSKIANKYRHYSRLIWVIIICSLTITILLLSYITRQSGGVGVSPIPPEEKIIKVEVIEVGSVEIYSKSIAKTDNNNKISQSSIASGIVNKISVDLGDTIEEGDKLLTLTDSYTGDDIFEIQEDLAQKQLEQAEEQFSALQNTSDEREDLADEQLDDFLGRQELLGDQLNDVNEQIDSTEVIMEDIVFIIEEYEDFADEIEDQNPNPPIADDFLETQYLLTNQATINGQKQALGQYQSTLDSLIARREQIQYETDSNNPGAAIAEITNDLTKQQIDNELELAELSVELAELNLELVRAQEELRTVRATASGTIEQINYKEGELINPGNPLFIINGDVDMVIISKVTPELALQIETSGDARTIINNEVYEADIDFVSDVPIDGNFYEVRMDPSSSLGELLQIGMTLEIELPISTETKEEGAVNDTYIPIDSIFKTNTREYVLVLEDGIAIEKTVVTGTTVGNEIKVISGISSGELVILDRRVVPGQKVEVIAEPTPTPTPSPSPNNSPTPTPAS